MSLKNRINFCLFFMSLSMVFAQEKQDSVYTKVPKRVYTTKALDTLPPPHIDGIPDDEGWNIVEWTGDYIENDPDENTPPGQQTKFKIVYDQKFLYIGFRCYDTEPEKIEKRLSRRDGFSGDWVEVNIDSYLDRRTGFSFTLSAAGVKGDEFISDNGRNWDTSWNPIWYAKTHIDEEGWTAELKIPFSQLRFGKKKEQVWGLQSTRRLFRAEERSLWQRVPRDAPGWVSEFGELRGLFDLEPQKQLEIQPFAVTQLKTYPEDPANPFRDGDDLSLNGGLDAKIGITNDLTLDLTVNPDFGQVEADPAAITLDGFEIFFKEQRPFFVENKNIFDYRFADNQDNLFYSRRIGRSPQGNPDIADDEYIDQPGNTTILGAAKFSGKTKDGWSLGLLESVTGKEYAVIDDGTANGNPAREEIVEPLTNYLVGRAQKDFNDRNSYIGGIFTATNRNIEGDLDFLRKAAYTGGVDFKHNWKERKYYVEGNMVASHVTGSPGAIEETQRELTHLFQRVDATHVEVDPDRTSLTGTGGRIELGKNGGGHWRYNGGLIWRSPELELNDVGFLRQADEIKQYANLSYQNLKPFGKFRRINLWLEEYTTYDFEGNFNQVYFDLGSYTQFTNNWWANVGFIYKPRIFSNTVLRGGPRFRYSDEFTNYSFFGTDTRKKLSFRAGVIYSGGQQNAYAYGSIEAGINYQPLDALNISLTPVFSRSTDELQYIEDANYNGTPRYVLGSIEQQTLSASIRFNYSINPNLSIQYYGQPFVFRANYDTFSHVSGIPTAKDFRERRVVYEADQLSFNNEVYEIDEDRNGVTDYSFDDPDFTFVQFRSNLVLRWEYIPGSEIFLVWSQGINGSGNPADPLFRSLDHQILRQQPENIFLIKATYRFIL